MNRGQFSTVATLPGSPKYAQATRREDKLYEKAGDIRTPFGRDFTRILHSSAYRRLKHKTQVFFSPGNDHISTRIEHVNYVDSIASTICKFLGLNDELARAIAIGHDLGHPPFGHHGEKVLNDIVKRDNILGGQAYWHEKNGLYFVDNIELLEGPDRRKHNLDLTYAVRDGIIAHCGEIHDRSLHPREEVIDLAVDFDKANAYSPFTWEGCVVKVADKISYLGRDIEDALSLEILDQEQLTELDDILASYYTGRGAAIGGANNTTVIHLLILDLGENSNLAHGIRFSDAGFQVLKRIQAFNYEHIYRNKRLDGYKDYSSLIIHRVYNALVELWNKGEMNETLPYFRKQFPTLTSSFLEWIGDYWDRTDRTAPGVNLDNKIMYHLAENPGDYNRAVIDYISGMTDQFIEKLYQELIRF